MSKLGFEFLGRTALVFSLGLGACTPRDVKVLSDADRAQLDRNKAERSANGARSGATKDDLLMAAYLTERQAEALQMLTWVLDSSSFNPTSDASLQLLVSASKADQRTVHLNFVNSQKNYMTYKATTDGALHAHTDFVPGTSGAEIAGIQITAFGFSTYLQSTASKDTVQATDINRELSLSPSIDKADEFDVMYTTQTQLKITKASLADDRKVISVVTMRIRMDGPTKKIELLSSSGNARTYDRYMLQQVSSTDLKFTFDVCAKVQGTVSVTGKGPSTLKIDETGFSAEAWTSALAPCETRPVLDWRRFLEN
jgi:hypothetical protein